jgi:predicted DNA binding CopG/RHH family protein
MSTSVMVNIRLSREDLLEYRHMALEEGQRFTTYIRRILRAYANHKKQGKASQK